MKKVLIFLLLLVILGGMIFIVKNPFCYNRNYWDDIKIKGSHLYSDIIMQRGEPIEIKNMNNEIIVDYTDIQFVWYNTDLQGIFARVEIISDKISVGKRKLCIGSDKKEVQSAYKSVFIQEIRDLPENCLGYIDKDVYIIYSFDQYDKVEKISISHGV